jgi:hypothetical protein
MLKQCSRTSTSWTRAALRCGAVALGAGLLSATTLTSAEAADSWAAPQPAAQDMVTGNDVNAPAPVAQASDSSSTDSAAEDPSAAAFVPVHGTVIASTGLHVRAWPNGAILYTLSRGALINIWCYQVSDNIKWYMIQRLSPQEWVDGDPRYVHVPQGSVIPSCLGLRLPDEPTEDAGTPMG